MAKKKSDPEWYMIVCKFKVDKSLNGGEHWKHEKHVEECNDMLSFLRLTAKNDWKRLKHVFYFKGLDDALHFKMHYYYRIKYVGFLDEDMNLIK